MSGTTKFVLKIAYSNNQAPEYTTWDTAAEGKQYFFDQLMQPRDPAQVGFVSMRTSQVSDWELTLAKV